MRGAEVLNPQGPRAPRPHRGLGPRSDHDNNRHRPNAHRIGDAEVRTVIAEHVVVAADPATTFDAARTLDLITVRTPLVTVSMWIRGLPVCVLRPATRPVPPGEGLGLLGLVAARRTSRPRDRLRRGRKVLAADHRMARHSAGQLRRLRRTRLGKIAANFSVLPYGGRSTLLSYECRTVTTDPQSRRRFLRYWWLIRPFVGHIMRATLKTIKADAEAASKSRSGMRAYWLHSVPSAAARSDWPA